MPTKNMRKKIPFRITLFHYWFNSDGKESKICMKNRSNADLYAFS